MEKEASMDAKEIQGKIHEAKQLVGGSASDPLTQIAFREVFRVLLQQSLQPTAGQNNSSNALVAQHMQLSEFLAQVKIKSETDRLTSILYYYLHDDQVSSTREKILEAYAATRIRRPKNLSDVIARCIRKGHIIESFQMKDGQKTWQITDTGKKYIEEQLMP